MPKANNSKQKKFEEALQLLNEAAKDKKGEIQNLLGEKYDSIRQAIEEAISKNKSNFNRVRKLVEGSIDESKGRVKQKANELNEDVSGNPWKYLGGTALGALLLGFIMGSSRKK